MRNGNKPVKFAPGAMYGFCPRCGAPGESRERRPNGNDTCQNGHSYPSIKARAVRPDRKRKTAKKLVIVLALASMLRFEPAHAAVKYPVCNPPLPYSCTTVRWAVSTFSREYLEQKGKERGMTACMRKQAKACIAGAP